ncbi:MAG TPA: substrate-binding domain-containing protein [Burkholderiales bacterium]|nr:substrate-binding domain-containing protein [Burkholderiales bacterium]
MAAIDVMMTLAFKEAFVELAPRFERESGHEINGGTVPTAVMVRRLKEGDRTDVVISSAAALAELIEAGVLDRTSRTDLAACGVGVAVRAGAPRPDLSCAESFRRAVLGAESIVYSHGPSGVYLNALFDRMGIAGEIASKVKRVQGEPAGGLVARGEAEIGFQQMSELLPVPGIDIVGPLPPEIQEITRFAGAVHARTKQPEAASALVKFFTTPDAREVMKAKGLEPV